MVMQLTFMMFFRNEHEVQCRRMKFVLERNQILNFCLSKRLELLVSMFRQEVLSTSVERSLNGVGSLELNGRLFSLVPKWIIGKTVKS